MAFPVDHLPQGLFINNKVWNPTAKFGCYDSRCLEDEVACSAIQIRIPDMLFTRFAFWRDLSYAIEDLTELQYVSAKNSTKLTLLNPWDESTVAEGVQVAGPEDVDLAVAAASEACRKGPWSKFTGQQRATCMLKFADLVEKNAERLGHLESLPTGRPVNAIVQFDLAHMVQVYRCEFPMLVSCPDTQTT